MAVNSEVVGVATVSLSGNINNISSVQWSADNKISISTDKGIYIMGSYCCPTEPGYPLTLHKQFISSPQETLAFPEFVNREKLHTHLEKDYLYTLMLDNTLSPKTANSSNLLCYKTVMWAPLGSAGYRRCLLASLTLDHRLTIHLEGNQKWETVADVTTKHYDICKDKVSAKEPISCNSSASAYKEYLKMTEIAYSLAPIEITWTHLFDMERARCYLVAAMKNGHIVLWRTQTAQEIIVELAAEWGSDLGPAKCLFWQSTGPVSGFLIVGLVNGLVFLLQISEDSKDNTLQFSEPVMLWKDKDNIPVDRVITLKQNRTMYVVVCAKLNFLIGCSVNTAQKEITLQSVQHIQGQHHLPVTDMAVVTKGIRQQQFLLSSLDGRVFQVDIDVSDQGVVTFVQSQVTLPVDEEKMVPCGVASSPNGVMHCALYILGSMFDHLIIREPLKIVLFTTASLQSISELIVRQARGIMPVPFASNYADMADFLRSHLCFGKALPSCIQEILTAKLPDQSVYSLQLVRYILKISLSGCASTSMKFPFEPEVLLVEVEKQLMKKHCLNVCFLAATRLDQLTLQQRLSFNFMSDWLFKACDVVVADPDEEFETKERCLICWLGVPFEDLQQGSCANSHKFARCCHSLLLVGSDNYLKCPGCRTLALADNIWNLKPNCIYCGCLMKNVA